jgi:ubiquinone/menaquinone biosynthesis C-methylase UbiE
MTAVNLRRNLEFRKGFIEHRPIENNGIDFVISNCVLNLSTDKPAVFREIHRVLKPGSQSAITCCLLRCRFCTPCTRRPKEESSHFRIPAFGKLAESYGSYVWDIGL